jgi:8-oxo-dGTP pyrophosphatase MutT (NUDIX family)
VTDERAERPAARILLRDPAGRVLLFRFVVAGRPPFWCTAGGAVDPGETFEQAAVRELREETGIVADCGPVVATRRVAFVTVEGVPVNADERYFHVRAPDDVVRIDGHTELEKRVMQEWRWFDPAELDGYGEAIFPTDLAAMLAELDR